MALEEMSHSLVRRVDLVPLRPNKTSGASRPGTRLERIVTRSTTAELSSSQAELIAQSSTDHPMSGLSTSPRPDGGFRIPQRRPSATQLNLGSPSLVNSPPGTPPTRHTFERTPSPSFYPKRGPTSGSPRIGLSARAVSGGALKGLHWRELRRYAGLALAIVSLYTIYSWSAAPQATTSAAPPRKISYTKDSDVLGLKEDRLELGGAQQRPRPPPVAEPIDYPPPQAKPKPPPAAVAFRPTTKKNRGLLDIDVISTKWDASRPPLSPPRRATSSETTEDVDAEVCPERHGQPCAFLVPAWLGEQETKAQMHLYQLGLLALSLGRTLVLPNVEKSRLSVCAPSPFEFYYDPDALQKLGIPTIRHSEFVEWSERRQAVPEAQVITVEETSPKFPMGVVQVDVGQDPTMVPLKAGRKLCMTGGGRARLDFAQRSPLLVRPQKKYQDSVGKFGKLFVDTLRSDILLESASRSSPVAATQPEVLAFNYELRYDILKPSMIPSYAPHSPQPAPFAHWAYSSAWTDLGESIVESLSPVVAIHWRTEQLAPSHLSPCVDSLYLQLEDIQRKHPSVRNVYLATDYPLENGTPRSGTMANVLTEEHHAAFRKLLTTFSDRFPDLRLTTFAQEEKSVGLSPELKETIRKGTLKLAPDRAEDWEPTLADLDPGLVGILDKTIASKAEIFLAGSPGANKYSATSCGKQSSFTGQVVDTRKQTRLEEGSARLWNAVYKWSTKEQNLDH